MLTIEERAKDIYRNYIEVICPYVMHYELLANEFPVEILNEIRAIFTHMSKYYLSDDALKKENDLSKAEGHIKRSILDCYKYICMAYDDKYSEFERMYRRVDLSFVDNGEFLPKLLEARKKAVDQMLDARKSDVSIISDENIADDDLYSKYEKAFVTYSSVYELINKSYKKLENLRKKAILKDFLAVGGWVIGIIGIALTIISFFF